MLSRWQTVHTPAMHWHVHPAWLTALLGPRGLRWEEWHATGRVTVVKDAPHRKVYRVELDEGAVYIKHYPVPDLRSRVRQWLRPTKARHEWQVAQAIASQQVPTVEPLALGEADDAASILVTRELRAEPLDLYLTGQESNLASQPRTRHWLTERLARWLARLHDAGVEHADLHPGNLLVRGALGDKLEIFLIDLFAARLGPPLSWEASARNVVLFALWFWPRSSRGDRWRFGQSYLTARRNWTESPPDEQDWLRLEAVGWEFYLEQWRRRDGRCFRAQRDVQQRRQATGSEIWAVRSVGAETAAVWLADPDEPLSQPGTVILKQSPTATVAEVDLPLVSGGSVRVIYKRFQQKKSWDAVVDLFRMNPGQRSWLNGWRLHEARLPTPQPMLLIQTVRHGLAGPAYLATRKLEGADDLMAAWCHASPAQQRELIESTARLLRQLHHHGLSHRDLKAANLLVTRCAATGRPELHFIDLVGMTRHVRIGKRRRVRNLARLAVSFRAAAGRTDLLRFLRAYLGRRRFTRERWREWWRGIEAHVQQKVRLNRRRGRPVS
ncbi:MAG TPA: lipopolysaccharide kinase InaA family protein [Gemmatales bacterium]|nr:lipopolysaccharide kinase InaA family protein [Gemmatales bacterium]HMP59692.1 lipopolysaccharide kinase InaA family protein [Gemmatales bacterium]